MNKKEIIIVTNPMIAANRSAEVTLSKFLRVIAPLAESIKVIGGNLSVESDLDNVELISFPIVRHPNKIRRIISVFALQLNMAKALIRLKKKIVRFIFGSQIK